MITNLPCPAAERKAPSQLKQACRPHPAPKLALFSQIPIGARFEHRGHRYQKLAMSFAGDERGWGNVFNGATEVLAEGEVELLQPCPKPPAGNRSVERLRPFQRVR